MYYTKSILKGIILNYFLKKYTGTMHIYAVIFENIIIYFMSNKKGIKVKKIRTYFNF